MRIMLLEYQGTNLEYQGKIYVKHYNGDLNYFSVISFEKIEFLAMIFRGDLWNDKDESTNSCDMGFVQNRVI
jgi:hypothetical protein